MTLRAFILLTMFAAVIYLAILLAMVLPWLMPLPIIFGGGLIGSLAWKWTEAD